LEEEMRTNTAILGLMMALVVGGLLVACGGPAPPETTPTALPTAVPEEEQPTAQPPSGDGEALLQERCTVCHSLDRVRQAQKTHGEWEQTVLRMIGKGAQLNENEQGVLIEYLAETYGP
jgi:cytochrome c5